MKGIPQTSSYQPRNNGKALERVGSGRRIGGESTIASIQEHLFTTATRCLRLQRSSCCNSHSTTLSRQWQLQTLSAAKDHTCAKASGLLACQVPSKFEEDRAKAAAATLDRQWPEWRSDTSCVRCVRTPRQQNTWYFWYVISQNVCMYEDLRVKPIPVCLSSDSSTSRLNESCA